MRTVAPLLLRGARSGEGAPPVDVLLREGRIAAVGPSGTVAASGAEPLDLGGRFIGPGLWDAHVHFTQHVIRRRRIDLVDTASAADVLRITAEQARTAPADAGGLVTGWGFRDALWPDVPTLAAIDAAVPDVPIALISADLHCAWINTRAAELLGAHPDDSGLLLEKAWADASRDRNTADSLPVAAYAEAADAAAARGVVGIVDFEYADNLREWPERVAAGVSALRVEASIWPDRLEQAIAAGRRSGEALDVHGITRVGRLKIVVDGSLNTRTAYCWDPYPGLDPAGHDSCGRLAVPPEALAGLLERAREGAIGAAVHAIGDRANTEVLDAFEALGMPGVVEHAQLVSADDFPRFAALGLVASVQPEHAMDDRDVADRFWPGRTDRAFAFGSLHAAGAELHLGSDAPVAPLDPWISMAAAVWRSRGERDAWHPSERLPLEVALAATSRGRTGLHVGDPADLVVTDLDPATASRDALRAMPVAVTLMGGVVTHRAL